ncbi:site-specific integrase [Enterococcus sp. DIV0212c]|uniref:tyrosine-type recombinase/integrase n=1 Tax=Enterococcus sp. DIV0212c TaxID=2230867 RepID=UPI001A9AA525|nr:site-specific integrase [Enterococcus sp. DIV0212c]MBO1353719.1 site-specific integrase [Enterococcus sp. DIV0212c]
MSKKGENIYKRKDGRWEGRYVKNRNTDGKIQYGYVYGKKYAEVKERLVILKAKYAGKENVQNIYYGDFSDWVLLWREKYLKKMVKETTFSVYSGVINNYLLLYFNKKRLTKINVADVQEFIEYLEKLQLSSGYIRNIFHILKVCLREAEKKGYINQNPCIGSTLPKTKIKTVQALTMKEQRKLELVAFQTKTCSPIILALYSGMRIGEISGLKWSDIDFDQETIHVQRTVYRISKSTGDKTKTQLIEGSPKTESSRRIIPLSQNLKKYLLEKKKEINCEYVIADKGRVIEPRLINYRFKRLLCIAGLENIHFHALRHTFATRCLENGADITSLSRLLGHTSVKMTLDTYTDSMLENRRAAISAVDCLLSSSSQKFNEIQKLEQIVG